MIFYVYELCFPEGKPFYVGKGSDDGSRVFNRAHFHWRKHQLVRTLIRAMKDRGEQPVVRIVFESSEESKAFEEERARIAEYGRRFDGGLLWNVSDGGLGGTPRGRPLSDEHKAKISAANLGRVRSDAARARMRSAQLGKKKAPEHIKHSAESRRGLPVSDETRAKISAAQKGKPRKKHSEETKQLMALSAKAGWAKRRAKLSA